MLEVAILFKVVALGTAVLVLEKQSKVWLHSSFSIDKAQIGVAYLLRTAQLSIFSQLFLKL
jgi:hypothetical protein